MDNDRKNGLLISWGWAFLTNELLGSSKLAAGEAFLNWMLRYPECSTTVQGDAWGAPTSFFNALSSQKGSSDQTLGWWKQAFVSALKFMFSYLLQCRIFLATGTFGTVDMVSEWNSWLPPLTMSWLSSQTAFLFMITSLFWRKWK